jgi:lysyl-tRNA synthetase, class II
LSASTGPTRGSPSGGTSSCGAPSWEPGYSELVDRVVQRARLTAQSLLKAGGDPEAMELDEDFLRALEYGMPPTGGMGMGIDRLLMTLIGENIRETLLFPFVRPD